MENTDEIILNVNDVLNPFKELAKVQRFKDECIEHEIEDRPINLELFEKNVPYCSSYSVMHKENHKQISLPCKRWDCPICSIKNRKELIERMNASEVKEWKVKSFITLTVPNIEHSEHISEAFNYFNMYIKQGGVFEYITFDGRKGKTKKLPKRPNFKFLRANEIQVERYQKTNVLFLHIHLIINEIIPKNDIIPIWQTCLKLTSGLNQTPAIIDIRPVHNVKNAGNYMFKYLTKTENQDLFNNLRKMVKKDGEEKLSAPLHRYSCSRGVLPVKIKKMSEGLWIFLSNNQADIIIKMIQLNESLKISYGRSKLLYEKFSTEFKLLRKILYSGNPKSNLNELVPKMFIGINQIKVSGIQTTL